QAQPDSAPDRLQPRGSLRSRQPARRLEDRCLCLARSSPRSVASKCVSHGGLPDLRCTPGALNRNVKQRNIKKTICVPNWTDTVRPPTSYTNKLKIQGFEDYSFGDKGA